MPLTERILAPLPGPQLLWFLVWSIMMPAYIFLGAAYRNPGLAFTPEDVALTPVLTYSVLASLWGVKRLRSSMNRLQPVFAGMVLETHGIEESWPFRSSSSTAGPFLLTAVTMIIRGPGLFGPVKWVTFLGVVIAIIYALPGATLLWLYGSILWGTDRFGRSNLRLAPFEEDSSLGLGTFGALTADAFGTMMLVVAPLFIGISIVLPREQLRAQDLLLEVAVVLAIVALLFSSVYRLHRRLVIEKTKRLAWAKHRYGEAFRAATTNTTEQTLRDRVAELQLAAEIERRAAAIQTWPFDVSAFRTIGAIVSGVLTALFARLLLTRVGL